MKSAVNGVVASSHGPPSACPPPNTIQVTGKNVSTRHPNPKQHELQQLTPKQMQSFLRYACYNQLLISVNVLTVILIIIH